MKQHSDVKPVMVQTAREGLFAVATGKADAYVGVLGINLYLARKNGITNLEVAALYGAGKNGQRFGVRKDWPELAVILDKALAAMPKPDRNRLFERWLPAPAVHLPSTEAATADDQVLFTQKERAWLDEHPVVRVLLHPHWAPVEFRDDQRRYLGISMDYLRHLEKILGIRLQPADIATWEEGVELLRNKHIDMATSMSKTTGRESFALFTTSYISMPVNIFTNNDVSYIGTPKNLADKQVAVAQGNAISEWLRHDHPDIRLVPVSTTMDGLKTVSAGKADAFIGNTVIASYYLGKMRLTNVRIAGDTPYAYKQSMTVRDDWPIFAGILQKALDAIEQPEKDAIFNRWMSIKYEHRFDSTLLCQGLAAVVLILALFFYWNRRLAGEVAQRKQAERAAQAARETAELAKENAEAANR
ncbi:MAG: hypothetical protein D3910_24790, partial [Candidatus Electrothrix sp. ATG2]|nr:hypothetical protein [Candidatus Electrothrix sp. ATG2]